jgi:hypothetical protein
LNDDARLISEQYIISGSTQKTQSKRLTVSVTQFTNEIMSIGSFCSGDYLFLSSIGFAKQ